MTGLHLEHKQQKYFWVLGIPLIVAVLYGASIGSPFVYDDRIHIFENTDVTGFQGLMDFASVIRIFQSKFGLLGRPVLIVTYGLNYLYSGSDPAGFRLTNLFIHTANCLLVFVLILLLSRTFGGKNNRNPSPISRAGHPRSARSSILPRSFSLFRVGDGTARVMLSFCSWQSPAACSPGW